VVFARSKKVLKKSKKSLPAPDAFIKRLDRRDKSARKAVQKNFEKSEKKACQRRRDLISVSKPNQTNGETND
jgi:hypothetical protein